MTFTLMSWLAVKNQQQQQRPVNPFILAIWYLQQQQQQNQSYRNAKRESQNLHEYSYQLEYRMVRPLPGPSSTLAGDYLIAETQSDFSLSFFSSLSLL